MCLCASAVCVGQWEKGGATTPTALHHAPTVFFSDCPLKHTGYAAGARERARRPSLIHGGKRVGQSRVRFAAPARVKLHRWTADFFVSALHLTLPQLLLAVAALYLLIFLIFAALWWAVWRGDPRCLSKSEQSGQTFATAFLFSIATTQTIGKEGLERGLDQKERALCSLCIVFNAHPSFFSL